MKRYGNYIMTEQYDRVEQMIYGKEEMLRMIANTLTLYDYL